MSESANRGRRARSLRLAGVAALVLLAAGAAALVHLAAGGGTSAHAAPDTPNERLAGHAVQTAAAAGGRQSDDRRQRFPAHLLRLPAAVDAALVFDLGHNRMYVFERSGEVYSRAADFFFAAGKNGIDKRREGDEKTPIGIYYASSFIPGREIPAIYGAGAFPINYPNSWDRQLGRTGSGIWIHGTDKDEDSLLPQSSRGCLTLRNLDFLSLAKFIRFRLTPVVISKEVDWISPAALAVERESVAQAVETWQKDWESLDTARYLRHYSRSFRTETMDLRAWSDHKWRVNAQKTFIKVELEDLGIYRYPDEQDLVMVTYHQRYRSSNFNARARKNQFWRRENGKWRIVHEGRF